MKVHQEHQSLHGDDIDPPAVGAGHLQHLQVSDTEHEEGEQVGEQVEEEHESHEAGAPCLELRAAEGARSIELVEAQPGQA